MTDLTMAQLALDEILDLQDSEDDFDYEDIYTVVDNRAGEEVASEYNHDHELFYMPDGSILQVYSNKEMKAK